MWLLRHSQFLTEGSCQRAVNSDIPGLDSDSCPSLKKHRFSDKIATEYLCFLYNSLGSPPQAENNRQGVNVMQTKCHKSNKLGQVSDPHVPVCWDMGSDTCPNSAALLNRDRIFSSLYSLVLYNDLYYTAVFLFS